MITLRITAPITLQGKQCTLPNLCNQADSLSERQHPCAGSRLPFHRVMSLMGLPAFLITFGGRASRAGKDLFRTLRNIYHGHSSEAVRSSMEVWKP